MSLSQAFIIIIIIINIIIRYANSANLFCMSTYVEHQLLCNNKLLLIWCVVDRAS